MKGVCVSTGSACSTGSGRSSHVLLAIGLNEELAGNVIRMTISSKTTKKEIDETIKYIKEIVSKQRQLSKEYNEIINPYRRYGWRK
jgi:cysteine desulfurase